MFTTYGGVRIYLKTGNLNTNSYCILFHPHSDRAFARIYGSKNGKSAFCYKVYTKASGYSFMENCYIHYKRLRDVVKCAIEHYESLLWDKVDL